jgi:hypothetical protein
VGNTCSGLRASFLLPGCSVSLGLRQLFCPCDFTLCSTLLPFSLLAFAEFSRIDFHRSSQIKKEIAQWIELPSVYDFFIFMLDFRKIRMAQQGSLLGEVANLPLEAEKSTVLRCLKVSSTNWKSGSIDFKSEYSFGVYSTWNRLKFHCFQPEALSRSIVSGYFSRPFVVGSAFDPSARTALFLVFHLAMPPSSACWGIDSSNLTLFAGYRPEEALDGTSWVWELCASSQFLGKKNQHTPRHKYWRGGRAPVRQHRSAIPSRHWSES